jgi:hypothetical protein
LERYFESVHGLAIWLDLISTTTSSIYDLYEDAVLDAKSVLCEAISVWNAIRYIRVRMTSEKYHLTTRTVDTMIPAYMINKFVSREEKQRQGQQGRKLERLRERDMKET